VRRLGCRLKTARHIRVKFGRPLADSRPDVHTKFRRDPFSRFALVNDALSYYHTTGKPYFLSSTYTRITLNFGHLLGPILWLPCEINNSFQR